jgi:hypothetical protein
MIVGRFASRAGLAISFLFGFLNHAQATTVYSQPTNYSLGVLSQFNTAGGLLLLQAYDNFSLSSAATLDSVSWVGSIQGSGAVTGFTINIYGSTTSSCPGGAASCPNGSLLSSTAISGNAGQTFLQTDNQGNPAYAYSATIDFAAAANTQYWLSIVGDAPSPTLWLWETASGGDGLSFQNSSGQGVDLAFTLDTPVPEPSSVLLLSSGLLLLGLAGSRVKR